MIFVSMSLIHIFQMHERKRPSALECTAKLMLLLKMAVQGLTGAPLITLKVQHIEVNKAIHDCAWTGRAMDVGFSAHCGTLDARPTVLELWDSTDQVALSWQSAWRPSEQTTRVESFSRKC